VYQQILADIEAGKLQGPKGDPGDDGMSPTVQTEEVDGGTQVTVTDAAGDHIFTVADGQDGDTPVKGVDYWTETDKQEITADVETAIAPTLKDIQQTADEAVEVAKGRATGYVFDTVEDMTAWLADSENTGKLNLGDNLYIRATDVPDYWWDGEQAQQLETQKVDLTGYVKDTDYATTDKGGVYRNSATYNVDTSTGGLLRCIINSLAQYKNRATNAFVSKGTLENIKDTYVNEGLQASLDTTLTEEGMAADAKAVGDALDGIVDKVLERLESAEGVSW
jgi:hypothetical protein